MKINREILINRLTEKFFMPRFMANSIIKLLSQIIMDEISKGNSVPFGTLGYFKTIYKNPRKGINPSTRTPMIIQGRNSIRFNPSIYLKRVLKELPK